jgi:hypothetical protein
MFLPSFCIECGHLPQMNGKQKITIFHNFSDFFWTGQYAIIFTSLSFAKSICLDNAFLSGITVPKAVFLHAYIRFRSSELKNH